MENFIAEAQEDIVVILFVLAMFCKSCGAGYLEKCLITEA